jgi:hypothetical protein
MLVDNCSVGGGVDFTLPWARTMGKFTDAKLNLDAPTDAARHAISFDRIRLWTTTRLTGSGRFLSAAGLVAGAHPFWFGLPSASSPGNEPAVDFEPPPGTTAVNVVLHCADSDRPARAARIEDPDCYADAQVPLELRGMEITLREDVAPTGSAVGGTLLGDKPVSAVRSLDYSASDAESGIARVDAVIDGSVVATRDLAGRCSFSDWSACPTTDRDTLAVDTRSVPDGRYSLVLRTIDAAGNRHDEQIEHIEVHNHESPTAAPATAVQLTAKFAASSKSSLVVPFGQRVHVRGRLTGAAQLGLAGARIDVFERAAKVGAREIAVGSTQTRRGGTFLYTLASKRPSRAVRLAYGSTAAPTLRVRVRSASTLTAALRGTRVRFRGRVVSRPLPPSGKRVILEGKAPGYAWANFATMRTDRLGRFYGSYRLRVRRPGVKLEVRVRLPREYGYPYLEFTGRPIGLRVR